MSLQRGIETVHDLGEVIRALDELTAELRAERRHRTDETTNRLGQFVNGVLFAGTVSLPAAGLTKEFPAPYAAVQISDPAGIGAIWVANGDLDDAATPGPGRFQLAKSGTATFALFGKSLSIVPTAAGVVNLVVFVAPVTASSS